VRGDIESIAISRELAQGSGTIEYGGGVIEEERGSI
jgi:hypothetical protein